jgi:hypothetical protein
LRASVGDALDDGEEVEGRARQAIDAGDKNGVARGQRAQATDGAPEPEFSRRIRAFLPTLPPMQNLAK